VFGKRLVRDMITRSAENGEDRRRFLQAAGAVGLGVIGASVLPAGQASAAGPSDGSILNFALNLEYLEAEFYSWAVHGHGLDSSLTDGTGHRGGVTGGAQVPFKTPRIRSYAREIAGDELAHVRFLRGALGNAKVSRPDLDIKHSFTAAARAAGLISMSQTFNPFANEDNFLLGAFLFEDVGVTAYKGAAPLISNSNYVEAAAGILAVEAYHAATIRTCLYEKEMGAAVEKLSDARDSLDGSGDVDQGIVMGHEANITPTDANGIAFSRFYDKVLNIVYLNSGSASSGGFYPSGLNGTLRTSAGS
jgi:hypothetical protein